MNTSEMWLEILEEVNFIKLYRALDNKMYCAEVCIIVNEKAEFPNFECDSFENLVIEVYDWIIRIKK